MNECPLPLFNSYTMAARDFADIYTQSPRAAGPRAAGVYVSKIPSSSGISDIYHLGLGLCLLCWHNFENNRSPIS